MLAALWQRPLLLLWLPPAFWADNLVLGHALAGSASPGAVLYIGLFASLIAFILCSRCVATLGATVTGISFHLVAVFTAVLAFLALGETVAWFHVAGIGLILAGFFVATVGIAPAGKPSNA